jgi:hypothetical protein
VLPGVTVTLADSASGMKYSTVTDASGSYALKSVPPARYEFTARLPGFATLTEVVTLGSGEDLQRRLEMKVGSLVETISVVCPVGGAARAPRGAAAVVAFTAALRPRDCSRSRRCPCVLAVRLRRPGRSKPCSLCAPECLRTTASSSYSRAPSVLMV